MSDNRGGGQRDNRGGGKQGQGGGNKGGGSPPKLAVSGTRSKLTMHVSFYKSGVGQTEDFRVWIGNEADPCFTIMRDASSPTPRDAVIKVENGEGWSTSDFSAVDPKTYTFVGIKTKGGQEIVKPIPADDPTVKTEPKKGKRIKVFYDGRELLDGETISGIRSRYAVRVQTFDKEGKAKGDETVVFLPNGGTASFKDQSNNPLPVLDSTGARTGDAIDVMAYTAKTSDALLKGALMPVIEFKGAQRSISFVHQDSNEQVTVTFHTK